MTVDSMGYTGTRLSGNALTRSFGEIAAVRNVNIELESGKVTVLLGLNGAGKTTLLSMLSGALSPDTGTTMLNGQALHPTMVGLSPQRVTLWPDLTPREQLEFMGECYNLADSTIQERVPELLQQFKLQKLQHRLTSELSGGMQQRLNVALALIHDPSVVLLDEPMQGLDPESRRLLRKLILEIAHTRKAVVVVSTHDIDEAEHLADLVAIMHEGSLLTFESKDELKKQRENAGVIRLRIPLEDQHEAIQEACAQKQLHFEMNDKTLVVHANQTESATRWLLDTTQQLGIKTSGLSIAESSLENILFELAQNKDEVA